MNQESIFIEADELLSKIGNDNLRIYDATILFFRSETDSATAHDKYLQNHIPGAAFFDHQRFSDKNSPYDYMLLSPAELAEQMGQIGISQDSEVVVYAAGMLATATRAWWVLRYAGHNNVRILNGGLSAWTKAGGKLETAPRTYPSTQFTGQFRPEMIASKEEVQKAMSDASARIEYALALEMYGGSHIPGSLINPTMDLLLGMDPLVTHDDAVSRVKDGSRYKRIITYCGGGIAATLNAVLHLIAGHENVAVYDGSLMEWMGEGMPTADKPSAQDKPSA